MRVFIVSQYPAAKRGNQPENAMTKEEAKKKQLLAAYAWGRHSAAAPECFALDPDKLVALCALGVMPPKVEKGAGSTPATGSAGKGVSVGERPAVTCVATTTNTTGAGEKTAGAKHTPGPWKSTVLRDGARIESDRASVAWVGPDDTRECADGRIVEVMTKRAVANAHLIAAAPDLLEALNTAQLIIHAPHSALESDCVDSVCVEIRGAIAKAEGRS